MFVFKTAVPSYVQTTYVEPQVSILFFRFNTRKGLAWSMQLATFIVTSGGFWQLCKTCNAILFHSTVGYGSISFAAAESLWKEECLCFKLSYDNSCM